MGKFEPGDVLALPASDFFEEIQAWRFFGNLGCENTARLEFPKIPETGNAKVIEEQLNRVLIHELSVASVRNCALASLSNKVIAVVKISFAQ